MRDYTREALIRKNGSIALGLDVEEDWLSILDIGCDEIDSDLFDVRPDI